MQMFKLVTPSQYPSFYHQHYGNSFNLGDKPWVQQQAGALHQGGVVTEDEERDKKGPGMFQLINS